MTDKELMQMAWRALDRLTDKVDGTGFSSSDEFKNATNVIGDLRARLDLPDGWQSMETAPKGKRLLVWSGQEIYAAHWAKNPYTDDEAWIVAEWGNEGDQALVKPVFWMLPPAAPLQQNGKS